MIKIAIFGSTGSIGLNSIKVIKNFPELFKIICLSTYKNIDLLLKQVYDVRPETVIIIDEPSYKSFRQNIDIELEILCGKEALNEFLSRRTIDLLINSLVGFSGLEPTITAIKNKIKIALANKESLVTAGQIIIPLLKQNFVELVPIDSEHNAILQCLIGEDKDKINKIILTASGGPFLSKNKLDFPNITIDEALKHPKWKMGNKISIDSATLVNKGLEVIEAHWLFNLPAEKIDVIIHPQSIIHSMVEFVDGSIKAQLGMPDMKLPIQYALTYPDRFKCDIQKIDFIKLKCLEFYEPDQDKFECLKLAYKALKDGGLAPTILNAANEVGVDLFLKGKIQFTQISEIIGESLDIFPNDEDITLEKIIQTDKTVREHFEYSKCFI